MATSAKDPLNVYQDTVLFYPTPPHDEPDDCSMALDATQWIRSGKDAEIPIQELNRDKTKLR